MKSGYTFPKNLNNRPCGAYRYIQNRKKDFRQIKDVQKSILPPPIDYRQDSENEFHGRLYLRYFQKGIYYRTNITLFGETGINKEQLIADKYLLPNRGYESGLAILNKLGLTSQMPRERVFVTNAAKDGTRKDKKLEVIIRPPKVKITIENKDYLQILDVLDLLEKAPVDESEPYRVIAEYIQKKELKYKNLLAIADRYYNQKTIIRLAHTASIGGIQHETA